MKTDLDSQIRQFAMALEQTLSDAERFEVQDRTSDRGRQHQTPDGTHEPRIVSAQPPRTIKRPLVAQAKGTGSPVAMKGAGISIAVAAVVLVVFGGISLLTGGDGGAASQPSTVASTAPPAPTTVPSADPGGRFEVVPFSGETWQLQVTEQPNAEGTYDVCFLVNPVGTRSDSPSPTAPWCDSWPKNDPRIVGDLLGVHHLLVTDTSYVMVVQLNDNPVDRITITGDRVDVAVTPFTLPGSGAQFAAVEVPQSDGTVTVTAFNQGVVADEQEGSGRIEPLVIDGTPIDDTTAATIGDLMGGVPMSDEELERITGSGGFVHSGYLIESTTTADGTYELGLIVYQEDPMEPGLLPPVICFSEYATTQGVRVGGGAACAPTQEKAQELAEFGLAAGGACGPIPKEQPVVDGNWLTLAVWGIPDTTEFITVGLSDGATVEIDVGNGVALRIWEGHTEITSITIDGTSQTQEELISSYLPIQGIGDDCDASDGEG